ncbi:MAG: glutamine-hydrolyzing carbamoyl-phosphate synthase small subunit [Spirochaetaceae bacterium]|jgi:carbamoyl-phosphate synthase small subunit|nr:glutamine-hydrolyzing carbamoyl-phosphate synthase small subunit [Spirochaetaceae bacterium]
MLERAWLVLEDGTLFKGKGFGAEAPTAQKLKDGNARFAGEIIFNTGMTGYHEILTDPSYTGQIVLMTYPHIGNYGDDSAWSESGPEKGRNTGEIKCSGMVVRSLYRGPVPHGRKTLNQFMIQEGVCGISDIDTRALTLRIRDNGSCNAIILSSASEELTTEEQQIALDYIKAMPSMEGANLLGGVGSTETLITKSDGKYNFALVDCGIKQNIINEIEALDCSVKLYPSTVTAAEILADKPHGILMSNGPGDPGVLQAQIALTKELLGQIPIFGICLGHQLLSQALGAKTFKMKFGHHGCNHPVRDEKTGKVFVTSQNHGFAVEAESLPKGAQVRFINANDGSVEGVEVPEKKLLCVQFHPEAAPGPVDSSWIFQAFLDVVKGE